MGSSPTPSATFGSKSLILSFFLSFFFVLEHLFPTFKKLCFCNHLAMCFFDIKAARKLRDSRFLCYFSNWVLYWPYSCELRMSAQRCCFDIAPAIWRCNPERAYWFLFVSARLLSSYLPSKFHLYCTLQISQRVCGLLWSLILAWLQDRALALSLAFTIGYVELMMQGLCWNIILPTNLKTANGAFCP